MSSKPESLYLNSHGPWVMDAEQALNLMKQTSLVTWREAQSLRALLMNDEPIPEALTPKCELMWLVQVAPASPSLH